VGLCTGQIKTGAPCRSERLAKYNQVRQPLPSDTKNVSASSSAAYGPGGDDSLCVKYDAKY
jgi:hypothetical protein